MDRAALSAGDAEPFQDRDDYEHHDGKQTTPSQATLPSQ